MINRDFYAFCRDQRKVEPDVHKNEVLRDVYNYMRECGVTKRGVTWYIDNLIDHEQGNKQKVAAYRWLRETFVGADPVKESPLEEESDGIGLKDYRSNPEYFGYYDNPVQKEPAYDPGQTAPCLICGGPWIPETVRTITFVRWDSDLGKPAGHIAYFYRVHQACHDGLGSDEQRKEFEGRMFESTENTEIWKSIITRLKLEGRLIELSSLDERQVASLLLASQRRFRENEGNPLVQALLQFIEVTLGAPTNEILSWMTEYTEEDEKAFLLQLRDGRRYIGTLTSGSVAQVYHVRRWRDLNEEEIDQVMQL